MSTAPPIPVNTPKQIKDLTEKMLKVEGNVRVRDDKGKDLVWRFRNGPELVGVVDPYQLARLQRMEHATAISTVIAGCTLKNPCGGEGRHR